MKRILFFLAFAMAAFAQPQPFSVTFTNPTGQACQGGQGALYAITGGLYTCQSNVFATASVATGGIAPFTTDGTNVTLPSGSLSVGNTVSTAVVINGISPLPVWNRHGAALTPSGCDAGGPSEPTVLYEANAQVLGVGAGTKVFKMWYSGGGIGICYAESLDGITAWTRHTGTVLAGYARGFMLHYGATYYEFAVNFTNWNAIDVYTSSDGVNFVLAQAGVIALGSTYDSGSLGSTYVILDGSTWKMWYECIPSGGGNSFGVALATASSPTGPWTKYASNPVVGGTGSGLSVSGPVVFKDPVGGKYWLWSHIAHMGTGYGVLPTQGARFSSTDGIVWAKNPYNDTFPRLTWGDGAGNLGGQIANLNLVEANGSTYLYYATCRSQTLEPCTISVATAPMGMSMLVATDEGATYRDPALTVGQNVADGNIVIDYDGTLPSGTLTIPKTLTYNLVKYSQSFTNAWWANQYVNASDGYIDPFDGLLAQKLVETTDNQQHLMSVPPVFATIGTNVYTASVFLRAGEREWAFVNVQNHANCYAWFSLTGSYATWGTVGSAITGKGYTDYGHGWWRIWITWTASSTSDWFSFGPATANGTSTYAGSVTSGIYAFGAQVVQGTVPLRYGPTAAEIRP